MKKARYAQANPLLLKERLHRHWSQQELADKLGTTPTNVSRWERGITLPGPYFRQQLSKLFEISEADLHILPVRRVLVHLDSGTVRNDSMSQESLEIESGGEKAEKNPGGLNFLQVFQILLGFVGVLIGLQVGKSLPKKEH